MAFYDALIAKWATLTGTTAQKIAAVNALTVTGPNVDVPVSAVVGKLMLMQVYLPLASFAQGSTTGVATHDNALFAAKMLMAMVTTPNAPIFQMSNAQDFATIKEMMDAILAQETAASGSTGFTQAVHDALLGLCATTIPWWQATITQGGGGLSGPVSLADLGPAGNLT
jgi:hypothetical protein